MVEFFSLNIYGAKNEGLDDAVPQAALAIASFCQQHRYVTLIFSQKEDF